MSESSWSHRRGTLSDLSADHHLGWRVTWKRQEEQEAQLRSHSSCQGVVVRETRAVWGMALVSQTGDMPVDHDPTPPLRKQRISQVRQLPKFISFSHLPELLFRPPNSEHS